jgi:hypothetical protein
MKKLILACLVLALFVPSLQARKKKEEAGKVKDLVYTDKKYDFSFSINKGWKSAVQLDKENFRVVLTQRSYETPHDYLNATEYTKVPRIVVYADTSSISVLVFLDSLVSGTYSSDQKKEILKEFEIIDEQAVEEGTERDKTVTRKRRTITIGEQAAALWEGKANYRKYVSTSISAIGGKRVYGAYGGGIVVAKKDNTIVLFHVISEWDYFANIMQDALTMITTLNWGGEEKEEKKEKGK